MEARAVAGALEWWTVMSFDPAIDGPGKLAKVMIWRNGEADQVSRSTASASFFIAFATETSL